MPEIEPVIFGHIWSKAIGVGATVFALNGGADHTHMVASIPPKTAVARLIGQVKGVSSARLSKSGLSDMPFFRQEERSVLSFDGKRLSNYIAYVERQKEHHSSGSTIPILERIDRGAVKLIRDPGAVYGLEEKSWRHELEQMLSA